MADALDVESAAGDVCCDQDGQLAVPELVEHTQPFGLHHVARQTASRKTVAPQIIHQSLRSKPRVDEDHGSRAPLALEDTEEQRKLLAGRDVIEHLVDGVGGQLLGAHNHLDWIVHLSPAESHDSL